ncbi:uncharacterized protein LOC117400400 isoform X1 [Acipenser ruthenus]|uniref:uncharacterized protein LOC117400400 isoform X1 n=1 Tax=Acipenser ruthenus TaxID=7906 RepID=UPI0027408C0B|nr:uncharacterized protein LOC117400400 isoform X1 [Acipenser ruthenus]
MQTVQTEEHAATLQITEIFQTPDCETFTAVAAAELALFVAASASLFFPVLSSAAYAVDVKKCLHYVLVLSLVVEVGAAGTLPRVAVVGAADGLPLVLMGAADNLPLGVEGEATPAALLLVVVAEAAPAALPLVVGVASSLPLAAKVGAAGSLPLVLEVGAAGSLPLVVKVGTASSWALDAHAHAPPRLGAGCSYSPQPPPPPPQKKKLFHFFPS